MQRETAASLTTVSILALMKLESIGRGRALKIVDQPISTTVPEDCREDLLDRMARTRLPRVQSVTTAAISDAWTKSEEQLIRAAELGIHAVSFHDQGYPVRLREIPDPPALLFVKGNLQALHKPKALAVVGTRKPTSDGKKLALRSGRIAAQDDYTVVSGLALGCDTQAHEGCLEGRGIGVAVLAHGLDRVYPAANRDLAVRLLEDGGCLTSEYPLGVTPVRSAFAERDRIQSGLSDGVLVIETDIKGGTMHTVRFALRQNRAVACIHPGHPERFYLTETTRGNRRLVERGDARPIADRTALVTFLDYLQQQKALNLKPEPATASREPQMALGL
ncbi:MAG: DNA-protecting protein DprA [Bryobacterales bacterium]|nr:DNA-protecting protein DprA [Bryobacterales bacterium]